ncbi:MAG: hypothetical protein PF638_02920 [Candidatus Delongbacteria bacterium]|jgi:hypothetical protein|nr:hypothetical protein [Candidatus Delongbacteria bacterium]
MLKFIKIILITALVLFVANCTKTQEDNQESEISTDIKTENVTDKSIHKDQHDHKEGELCIDPVASKVASFSMKGKYQDAIDVLVTAKDVPGYQWNKDKIYESMIYLYDKTKQYEKNIDVWRDGHSKGMVFKMDKAKKHFEPYLLLDGFDEIYEKDLELQKEIEKTE